MRQSSFQPLERGPNPFALALPFRQTLLMFLKHVRWCLCGEVGIIKLLLGFGNFAASFFYYFGYVYWSRPATGDPVA